MRFVVFGLALALCAPLAGAKSLEQAYNEAGPGEGYDKLLVLDPNVTYTGGVGLLQGKKSCIRGNGALCDLQNNQVFIAQPGTEALITGCCIINGTNADASIAVQDGAKATIDGNTICKNGADAVKVWDGSTATVKNNILYGSSRYGITAHQNSYSSVLILYNDVYNTSGNYMYFCPG
ncbi:MAG: right-handed parallel beta-helix repeat-containing protein [Candidatus Coatesbacteria bacterium]|nr:MAG: right-handed parallel beta-helix repeat-containing protein [Candidatus Coatesbacteria bacterium]